VYASASVPCRPCALCISPKMHLAVSTSPKPVGQKQLVLRICVCDPHHSLPDTRVLACSRAPAGPRSGPRAPLPLLERIPLEKSQTGRPSTHSCRSPVSAASTDATSAPGAASATLKRRTWPAWRVRRSVQASQRVAAELRQGNQGLGE
jgi:hypothetical protein